MYKYIILIVLCALVGKSIGQLRCYACSFSSVDTDRSCLEVTDNMHSVDCPFTYCTIMRQEFVDPAGQVASFIRGCEESPDYLNHDIVDSTFRTYYRACTNDLCNIGDGIQSVVGGNLSPTPEYVGDNLLVPGTGGGASAIQISFLLLFVLAAINVNIQ
ncbi:uncharacterized protein LOC133522137 [Cydia pomonella]|uniref:uncharacterized protein LOC133522137 n=1 Tax=Cydia pomonella TaxID=82600 RepID=UPI002ADD7C07|nr:uncharacterized protein LOC133522137 [Cydia pomonella]